MIEKSMTDGALPTEGHADAQSSDGEKSECHVWSLFALAAAREKPEERSEARVLVLRVFPQ